MARVAIFLAVLASVVWAQSPLERAVTLARERRYAEARRQLQGVPEPTPPPQRIAFHRLKAAIASGLNDPASAATEMQQALRFAPADPALLFATSVAEFQTGQLDSALSHAGEAIRLDPANEGFRSTLATSLIRHLQFQPAIDLLRASLPVFPKSARLRILLGIAQFSIGETEDATATLSDAITLDPAAEPAYRSLTQIVLEASTAPTERIVTQLCAWNATVCSALKLRVARESGNAALQNEAIAGLERAPKTDPVAPCELARAREWTNRLPEARTELERCVAADPSPRNHYRLGLIYQRLGFPDLAQQQMQRRNRLLSEMSGQTANGLAALKSVQ